MLSPEAQVIEKLFQIQTKDGPTTDYVLNPAQRFFDEQEARPPYRGTLIVKARQKGFSSVVLAKFTVRCLSKPGTHAVVLSHEAIATQRLFERVHFYLDYLKGPKAELGTESRLGLSFPKTSSTYYVGTAGARAFGRGDFITDLHCSEYAWWEQSATRHLAGLFQAVPDPHGRIYIESTGNGQDNDFYYMYKNHEKLRFKLLFYSWFFDDEYKLRWPFSEPWRPQLTQYADYMLGLKETHKLTDEQMYWYECKLIELREDLNTMQQEYPSEPDEAFQATGGAVFDKVPYVYVPEWSTGRVLDMLAGFLKARPREGFHYVIGADPSGGTGNDATACTVYEVETLEQVYALSNNRLEPVTFGHFLARLGQYFNGAYIVCEANNHGIAVLNILKKEYDKSKLYRASEKKWGFQNSATTKPQMVALLKEMIEDGLSIHDKETRDELKAFHEADEGKMLGLSDNLVIASCLAAVGLMKKMKYRWAYFEPKPESKINLRDEQGTYMFLRLEDILESIKKRSNKQWADQLER